jgi:ParB family chromosome partitioning protein
MSRNHGLGKGLSDLLGEKDRMGDVVEEERKIFLNVPLDSVKVGAYQPRKNFDRESLYELAESIKKSGLLQPIIVSETKDGYIIIAGERRWRACQILGMKNIPALIKEVDDKSMLECALVENVQRKDLNVVEEAEGYLRLMGDFGYSQEELSGIIGKSRSHIANILRLNTLPNSIKHRLLGGELSMGHARTLVGNKDAEEIADFIIDKGLNVRQTENLVKNWNKPLGNLAKDGRNIDPDLEEMMNILSGKFGMKVTIEQSGVGGRIVFHYYTLDQLDDILTKLS